MPEGDHTPEPDWIEWLVRIGKDLGLNPVRLRWKLMGALDSWRRFLGRGRQSADRLRYKNRICQACGTLQDGNRTTCISCGKRLYPKFLGFLLRRTPGEAPETPVSLLLGAALVLVYVRMLAYDGPSHLFEFSMDTLDRFGGNWPPAFWRGEWWRPATAVFLHAGIWHIGFNLWALSAIGPQLEEVFGKGRVLLCFMATGILASLGDDLVGIRGVSIGASGAIMGLIGLAAGWGHREGTSASRMVRDQMVKWALYTVVFGFFIGADNVAHVGGFLSGALWGWWSRPVWQQADPHGARSRIEGWIGAFLALGTLFLALFPPVG